MESHFFVPAWQQRSWAEVERFVITNNASIPGSRYVDIRNCKISPIGNFAATEAEKIGYMDEKGIGVYDGRHVSLLYNEINA